VSSGTAARHSAAPAARPRDSRSLGACPAAGASSAERACSGERGRERNRWEMASPRAFPATGPTRDAPLALRPPRVAASPPRAWRRRSDDATNGGCSRLQRRQRPPCRCSSRAPPRRTGRRGANNTGTGRRRSGGPELFLSIPRSQPTQHPSIVGRTTTWIATDAAPLRQRVSSTPLCRVPRHWSARCEQQVSVAWRRRA